MESKRLILIDGPFFITSKILEFWLNFFPVLFVCVNLLVVTYLESDDLKSIRKQLSWLANAKN